MEVYTRVKELLGGFHDKNPEVEIYLFGSIIRKGRFYHLSDIDIALKNSKTSRLQLYSEWSTALNRDVDIVMIEQCDFAEEILKYGEKVY